MELFKFDFILKVFLIISCCEDTAQLTLNVDSSNTVSKGTQAGFQCFSGKLPPNFFELGGRVEWSRYPRFSTSSMEVIARWSERSGTEIMLENPDDQYTIEMRTANPSRLYQRLIIRRAQKSDQGEYFCSLKNSTGLKVVESNTLELTVKYPPAEQYPMCRATPDDLGYYPILISCESEKTSPPTEVHWYKGNTKVADSAAVVNRVQSKYDIRNDEIGSHFECRLQYDDGPDITVTRSCQFSLPTVNVELETRDLSNGAYTYRVFAHANPPFVGNLNCTSEPSSLMLKAFTQEFPGYGTFTVGPATVQPQEVSVVCSAKNVFGESKTTVNITTKVAQFDIWPKRAVLNKGENSTFVCSCKIDGKDCYLGSTSADINWKYNGDAIDASNSLLVIEGNLLHVIGLLGDDHEARITCIASVIHDDVNSRQESSAVINAANNLCVPQLAESLQEKDTQNMLPFIVGVSILGAVLLVLVIVLTSVLWKRGKKQGGFDKISIVQIPQVTYRASTANGPEIPEEVASPTTIQRALPAQPVDSPLATTTLRSVVTTPALGFDTLTRQKLASFSSSTTTTTNIDLPYQEMVGDTGIVKSRHGSVTNDARPNIHALLIRSKSIPASMVPGPNGGFLPTNVATAGGRRLQRSASESHDSDSDVCYEDPDAVRERRRMRRAVNNDYQPAMSPILMQKELLLSQYANSSVQGDDSVFPVLAV